MNGSLARARGTMTLQPCRLFRNSYSSPTGLADEVGLVAERPEQSNEDTNCQPLLGAVRCHDADRLAPELSRLRPAASP